jgi:hypothetical protein
MRADDSRDPTGTLPSRHLGPSKIIRQWIGLSAVGESVECEPFHPSNGDWASNAELEVCLVHCDLCILIPRLDSD